MPILSMKKSLGLANLLVCLRSLQMTEAVFYSTSLWLQILALHEHSTSVRSAQELSEPGGK